MAFGPRPPSAEHYREKLKARATLARMRLHEGLAERWERAVSPSLQAEYAQRYRQLIGVVPTLRGELRAALERIEDGGLMPVADVIDLLARRSQENGFVSGGDAAGDVPAGS